VDDLAEHGKVSPNGATFLTFIMRHTFGGIVSKAGTRPEYVRIDHQERADTYGLERMTVCRLLTGMEKNGLIQSRKAKGTNQREYKVTPENWDTAPRWKEPSAKTEPAEKAPPAPTGPIGDKLIVKPGRKTSCSVRLSPKDREPVDQSVELLNEGQEPVSVSLTSRDSILLVIVNGDAAKKRMSATPDAQTFQNFTANKRVTDFECAISAILVSEHGKPPLSARRPTDVKFRDKIIAAAGPDLTAAEFESYVRRAIHERHRSRKNGNDTPGLLIELSRDAAAYAQASRPPSPAPAPTDDLPDLPPIIDDEAERWNRWKEDKEKGARPPAELPYDENAEIEIERKRQQGDSA
jgi:DNA-binding PadR family transcriptional regulator